MESFGESILHESTESRIFQALLDAGANVNATSFPQYGESVLAMATRMGSVALTSLLLEKGASPDDSQAFEFALALHHSRSADLISLLVRAGANVDKVVIDDYNLLEKAVRYNNFPVAKMLLDTNAKLVSGQGLWEAVYRRNLEMVQLLLDNGADPNWRSTRHKSTALEEELRGGTRRFHKSWNVDSRIHIGINSALIDAGAHVDMNGGGMLALAAKAGSVKAVKLLLDAGAQVNLMFSGDFERYETALQAAVGLEDPQEAAAQWDIIQLLMDAGADVNTPAIPFKGRTALQAATEKKNIRLTKFLVDRGADVNAPAAYDGGVTALQGAVIGGNIKIVVTVLEARAQVSAPPAVENGWTAIEAAARCGRLDIMSLLLANHEDPIAVVRECERVIEYAAVCGFPQIIAMLKNHVASAASMQGR